MFSRILLVKFRQMETKGIMNPSCTSTIIRYIPLKHVSYIDVCKERKTVDIVFEGDYDKITLTSNNAEGFSSQIINDMFEGESYIQIK